MVKWLVNVLLMMSLSLSVWAGSLTAQVDRFELGINETVQLVVTLSGEKGQRPDLKALYQDFSIEQHTQSSSVSIVNGAVKQQVKWIFLLSPNRKGVLQIPALTVGSLSSKPIEIKVGDSPAAQSSSDDVLMEVEVRPLHPYVKGQVVYIQRLYYARPFVDNASISSPKISQGEADIEFLGSSNPRNVKHNGRPYQLIERYYVVFPKHAGALYFEPSVFRGSLASNNPQRNRFQMPMFDQGIRVNAYSPKAELSIADKPKHFTGTHWLPASNVTLNMNWSQPPETLKMGEPVTVTIALMAEGMKAESLPEVALDLPDALKVYPDKPSFRSDRGEYGLLGLREEKFTLVANQAGEYMVPPVAIPWWNTHTDQQEVARLEGFTLKVTAGAGMSASSITPPMNKTLEGALTTKSQLGLEASPKFSDEVVKANKSGTWGALYQDNKQLILIVMAGVIIGLLVVLYRIYKRASTLHQADQVQHQAALKDALLQLQQACEENDAKKAIMRLPVWATLVGIKPATLAGVEACHDALLCEATQALTQAYYAKQAEPWQGEALWRAVSTYQVPSRQSVNTDGLDTLHPIY